jgi:hypothetical protein
VEELEKKRKKMKITGSFPGAMTFSIATLSITTFSIKTLSITGLFATLHN